MSGVCLYVRTRSLSGLLGGAVVKNPPANTGDARDVGLIPRSGMAPRSIIFAWRILWTEELGGR